MNLKAIQVEATKIDKENGFDKLPCDVICQSIIKLVLIGTEVSEAIECIRKNEGHEKFAQELADIVLRTAILAEMTNVNLDDEITKKMLKNKSRTYIHDGKLF